MSVHEVNPAIPGVGLADKALLRALLTKRPPYVFGPGEDPQAFFPVDAVSGAVTLCLGYQGRFFFHDPDDTTTPHDGVECLVTEGGRRYKVEETRLLPLAVLSAATAEQPEEPALGDAYLIPAGATGDDFAGHEDEIAVFTARGWRFVQPSVGRIVFVVAEGGYRHYAAAGSWAVGLGASVLGAQTVTAANLIGGRTQWVVVNMTTNAPPSVGQGIAYVIGSSPTGAWAGHARKIAVRQATGTGSDFVIYAPAEGWTLYDQDTNTVYVWDGTAWASAAGSFVGHASVETAGTGSVTAASGNSGYAYSTSTPPTTSARRTIDAATLTYAAKKPGAELVFCYRADVTWALGGGVGVGNIAGRVVALYRDSDTNALDWCLVPEFEAWGGSTRVGHIELTFRVAAADASAHTYRVAFLSQIRTSVAALDFTTLSRRLFQVDEAA